MIGLVGAVSASAFLRGVLPQDRTQQRADTPTPGLCCSIFLMPLRRGRSFCRGPRWEAEVCEASGGVWGIGTYFAAAVEWRCDGEHRD